MATTKTEFTVTISRTIQLNQFEPYECRMDCKLFNPEGVSKDDIEKTVRQVDKMVDKVLQDKIIENEKDNTPPKV